MFRLETTRLRDPERVSRLLLCVCLAHVWLMNAGVWVSKRGLRRQVGRHTRRQRGYFQIGWRFLQKLLACGQPLRYELAAYTKKLTVTQDLRKTERGVSSQNELFLTMPVTLGILTVTS